MLKMTGRWPPKNVSECMFDLDPLVKITSSIRVDWDCFYTGKHADNDEGHSVACKPLFIPHRIFHNRP